MKKLTICILALLTTFVCSGCIPETPPFKVAFDDCNVTILDRLTGEEYRTTRPYYIQLDSSRIKIEAGYKTVRNSFGVRIGNKPFDKAIILSGNWSLTED